MSIKRHIAGLLTNGEFAASLPEGVKMSIPDERTTYDEAESLTELADMDGAAIPEFAEEEFEAKAKDLPDADLPTEEETAEEKVGQTKEEVEEKSVGNGGAPDAAKVFGISEEQLQSEFNRYKADKLFKKINMRLTDPSLDKDEIAERLNEAAAYNLGGVTVLPNALGAMTKANFLLPVAVTVGYPFGAETFEAKKYLVKKAFARPVEKVIVYFDKFDLKLKKKRQNAREYKKLMSYRRNKQFVVAVVTDGLTSSEMKEIADILAEAGVTCVEAVSSANGKQDNVFEHFLTAAAERFSVSAVNRSLGTEDIITLLNLGADNVACDNAVEVVKVFRERLNI